MNRLIRPVTASTRLFVARTCAVPSRSFYTTPTKEEMAAKEKEQENDKLQTENLEKVPKHTHPGSKYALKNEDFGEEATYEKFANEPAQKPNPAWRMPYC